MIHISLSNSKVRKNMLTFFTFAKKTYLFLTPRKGFVVSNVSAPTPRPFQYTFL